MKRGPKQPLAKKRKRALAASVCAISAILQLPPDAVVDLIKLGRLKARRNRSRLQVDVMHPFDEYAIDYDSVLAYRELLRKQEKPEQGASGQ